MRTHLDATLLTATFRGELQTGERPFNRASAGPTFTLTQGWLAELDHPPGLSAHTDLLGEPARMRIERYRTLNWVEHGRRGGTDRSDQAV